MIEKLTNTYNILNLLEDQNSKKFVSNVFNDMNNSLELDLKEYVLADREVANPSFSDEEKEFISTIICKIEELETKILPKANLISSFSNTLS